MSDALRFRKDYPLYAPDLGQLQISSTSQALDAAYSSGLPVLIYVHGRAKGVGEPRKSVKEGIYDQLRAYGLYVVGFTWEADRGGFKPRRAKKSSDDFLDFISRISAYLTNKPGLKRPSLVAHSMGNIILVDLARRNLLKGKDSKIFKNLVLSAAAVRSKNHVHWLDKIDVADSIYVMVNKNDRMLALAGTFRRSAMLGKKVRPPTSSRGSVIYVLLNDLGVDHRYFVKTKGQSSLIAFFQAALSGDKPIFTNIATETVYKRVRVQRLG